MPKETQEELGRKLRQALELYEVAEDLKRQNLRREYPDESDEQIEARFRAWLRHRPGAEHGDGPQPGTLAKREAY